MRKMLALLLSGVLFAGLSAVFAQVMDEQKEGYYEVVKLFVIDKNYSEALNKVNILLEQAPESPELYLLRGQINVDIGDRRAALADFDKSVELDPKNDETIYYRAALKVFMNSPQAAYVDASRCIHLNPNNAMCYALRSSIRMELGDMGGAEADRQSMLAAQQRLQEAQNSVSK